MTSHTPATCRFGSASLRRSSGRPLATPQHASLLARDDDRQDQGREPDHARVEEEHRVARAQRRGGHAEVGARWRTKPAGRSENSAANPANGPPGAATRALASTIAPDCAAISLPGSEYSDEKSAYWVAVKPALVRLDM